MTRREFGAAAAAGTVALSASSLSAAEPSDKEGYIDAHVHVWPPNTTKYPLAAGFKKENMQPASFTPDELFRHARPVGVRRIVLIQMSYYRFDNSYMLDAIKSHPGIFSGVAVIDQEAARPRDEMRRLSKLGVRGFRIVSWGKDPARWLDGDGMQALWRCGADDKLAMCCLVNPDALPSIDAMCRKHSDTPVVIDHFARVGVDGTIRERDLTQLCGLARHKRVYVKISAFYALGKKKPPYTDLAPMIRRLVDAFGPERLMWATDCPFQVQGEHTYAASLELIRDRLDFLTADAKKWLLRKTAERLFFS